MKIRTTPTIFSLLLIATSFQVVADSDYPIAGVKPWQRPEGAPVIEWVKHDPAWYEYALTGINLPYPKSLFFLDNQGYWHTPFTRPGMLPPYDPRGWHR